MKKLLDGTWSEATLAWKTFRAQSSGPVRPYEKILARQIEVERCQHPEIDYYPISMTHRCAVCDKTVSAVQSKIGRLA